MYPSRSLAGLLLLLAACASRGAPATAPPSPKAPTAVAPALDEPAPTPAPVASTPAKPDPRAVLAAWLREKMPKGGEVLDEPGKALTVVHTVAKGDSWQSIAAAYLDLTETYMANDLANQIVKANLPASKRGALEGMRLEIPALLSEPYKTGDAERIGWPEDGQLRGFYVRGDTAARSSYVTMLDGMQKRDINAIVLDVKDYDGPLTFPSKVPLAVETGAIKNAPIRDYARAVRFAHKRGVRVIARISCFEDEFMAKARPAIAVRGKWGGPYGNGWLDPGNVGAQDYLIALAKEAMDNGVDEIQLDYVRYPVLAITNADFHLDTKANPTAKVEVITGFVHRMHEVTKPRGVPLSLDIFGVVAQGMRVDIDALGQDPPMLAPECEALSPMVYPSHYAKGFYGFEEPGNHPEIVGIGTKGTIGLASKSEKRPLAQVRPWLQAMYYKAPEYGPGYLAKEIKSAAENGGAGWLMWNPGQDWGIAFQAVPAKKEAPPPPAPAATASASTQTAAVGP